ncbi:MAG TPA: M50 family metallopeptidase, partial [Clostridia bacterium]|nr:M50 family metallopeptidase [Clostridia bacterium]
MGIVFILVAVLALSVLVFVHELGHFLVGKALGFKIIEFAIGFGPRIFKTTCKGIVYSLRVFPLGGFVRFFGEDEDNSDPQAMNNMPRWKRFLVLLSGSAANIIFAVLVGTMLFMTLGDVGFAVSSVEPNSGAALAGVQTGDFIYEVNDERLGLLGNVSQKIAAADDTFPITVVRDGKKLTLTVTKNLQNKKIGITIEQAYLKMGLSEAFSRMWAYTAEITREVFKFFGKIFTFNLRANEAAGPISTIGIMAEATSIGFSWLVFLTIIISVNLGIFNLIPFPALDGGRIFLLAVESIRGKA